MIEEDHQIGNKPEIIDISTTDTSSRAELIESVQRAIPKLNIAFDQFDTEEIRSIETTLLKNKDLFDTTINTYGLA